MTFQKCSLPNSFRNPKDWTKQDPKNPVAIFSTQFVVFFEYYLQDRCTIKNWTCTSICDVNTHECTLAQESQEPLAIEKVGSEDPEDLAAIADLYEPAFWPFASAGQVWCVADIGWVT